MKKTAISVLLLLLFFLSFHAATAGASTTDGRHVVLIYDDSGSMWYVTEDEETEEEEQGGQQPSDNWKLANYALQSLTALLGEEDELNVVRMSDPGTFHDISLGYGDRQEEIRSIMNWEDRGNTPLETVETSFSRIEQAMTENPDKEYWFLIVMDGAFNELDSSLQEPDELETAYSGAYDMFASFKENVEEQEAAFRSVFITMESFLAGREEEDMQRFTEEIWNETLAGRHLRAETEEEIIERVNETAALITNRDENVEEASDLLDITASGTEITLSSPYPLERITVIEQNMEEDTTQEITDVVIEGESVSGQDSGPFQMETPYDEEELRGTIYGAVSHIGAGENRAVPAGTYTITFAEEADVDDYQFIAEPAIDMDISYQRVENGELSPDESEYYYGSDMQLLVQFTERGEGEEPIVFPAEEAASVEVQTRLGEDTMELAWDEELQMFTAPFVMPEEEQTAVVEGYIPGFYQGEKEAAVSGVPERTLELSAEHEPWEYPLDEWEEDHELVFTVLADGTPVDEEELAGMIDGAAVDVENGSISFDISQEGSAVVLTPKEPGITALQSTGEHEVTLTLPGSYEGEEAAAVETVNVVDIPFVEKYLPFILWILVLLLLLIYIFGLLRKPRFEHNSFRMVVEEQRIRHGIKGKPQANTYNFKTPALSRWLVPYVPEKKNISGLTFIASKMKGQVMLAKNSQDPELQIRNRPLKKQAGKQDVPIATNTTITMESGSSRTTYRFTR